MKVSRQPPSQIESFGKVANKIVDCVSKTIQIAFAVRMPTYMAYTRISRLPLHIRSSKASVRYMLKQDRHRLQWSQRIRYSFCTLQYLLRSVDGHNREVYGVSTALRSSVHYSICNHALFIFHFVLCDATLKILWANIVI